MAMADGGWRMADGGWRMAKMKKMRATKFPAKMSGRIQLEQSFPPRRAGEFKTMTPPPPQLPSYVAALLLKHLPLVSRMESPGKEERNRIIFTTMLAILSGGAKGYA
jgi:hypothetical protein